MFGGWAVNKVVASLVVHQVPSTEKVTILVATHGLLMPGGELHLTDYDRQTPPVMRTLLRITVQATDGIDDTCPHVGGMLPQLALAAEFVDIGETLALDTDTETIRLLRARRP